jgi:hypothetical protein
MKSINDYTNKINTELFNKYGAFFAFGNAQFNDKKKEGVTYVQFNSGLICPKENAKILNTELNKVFDNAIKQQVLEFGADAVISYEYFNHEIQLTGDTSELIETMSIYKTQFPDLFTNEIILKVAKDCFKKAVDNDWF